MSMKILTVLISNTGNSRYIAEKISATLKCDIYEIQPKMNPFVSNSLLHFTGICSKNDK